MSEMSPLKKGKSNSRSGRKDGTMSHGKVRYYIGKKQYVPSESDLLCASESDTFGIIATRNLYSNGKYL